MKKPVYKGMIISLILITSTILILTKPAETQDKSFSYTRIYSDDKGVSHFADVRTDWISWGFMGMYLTEYMESKTINFFRCPSEWEMDWHPAPSKQFNIVLKGTVEIEVGDGEKRIFSVGSVFVEDDTKGRGHKAKSVGKNELIVAWIEIP